MDTESILYDRFNDTCNALVFNDSIRYSEPISIIRIVTSSLSVIGATSVIIGVFLTGKLSNSEVHPLFTLSVGDFIVSCTWIFGGAVWLYGKQHDGNTEGGLGLCYVLSVATSILSIVTYLLTVVYAAHAFIKMKELYQNRGRQALDSSKPWWYYLITVLMYLLCWGLPAVLILPVTESLVGIGVVNESCRCFVDFFNTRPDNGNQFLHSDFDKLAIIIASFNGVFYLVSCVLIIILYIFTLYVAWKIIQLQKYQQVEMRSGKIIKKLTARAFVFIGVFFVCGLPAFFGSIIVWTERQGLTVLETPDQLVLFSQALIAPLQGVLNALFYGWSRKEFRQAIKFRVKLPMKSTRKISDEDSDSDSNGLINVHNSRNYS